MAAFSYKSSAQSNPTSTVLSVDVPYPTGTSVPSVGDPVFLELRGLTRGPEFTWTPPAGWVQVGAAVRATDVNGFKNALQLFWKVYDGGTSVTVTTTTSGTFTWLGVTHVYTGSGTPSLVSSTADEAAAASATFQPADYAATKSATVVNLVVQASSSGNLDYATANGFTVRSISANDPRSLIGDQDVVAGTVTMPYFSTGVALPWLSKTFALGRTVTGTGWSVGQIKY